MTRGKLKFKYVRRCADITVTRKMTEHEAEMENKALDCLGKLTDPARWERV